jgi:hypothetical protein
VPDAITLYVMAVIFLATLIRSTLGFGEALVAVPMLAMRVPIRVSAPLAVLVSVIVAAVIVVQDWRHVHVRSASGLILSSLPGIPLGVWLLARGNSSRNPDRSLRRSFRRRRSSEPLQGDCQCRRRDIPTVVPEFPSRTSTT